MATEKELKMAITATNSITPVGYNTEMTAASVRAGISRLMESNDYFDSEGKPIISSPIEGICDEKDHDDIIRMGEISSYCLEILLKKYFQSGFDTDRETHLLLGLPTLTRPGPKYQVTNHVLADQLIEIAQKRAHSVTVKVVESGNASVIRCIEIARNILYKSPQSLCIIGGIDSLLSLDALDWFEKAERLKSETFGRNQAFSPGEAVGFMSVETEESAYRNNKRVLAKVMGVGLANEPSPFLSDQPSKGEGLTSACRYALTESSCNSADISAVLADLNGEYFRSKEWGYTELRCFKAADESRQLWHPADCMGSVGAASGAILINIAAVALSLVWIDRNVMVFCSDDEGECGAVVLRQFQ